MLDFGIKYYCDASLIIFLWHPMSARADPIAALVYRPHFFLVSFLTFFKEAFKPLGHGDFALLESHTWTTLCLGVTPLRKLQTLMYTILTFKISLHHV